MGWDWKGRIVGAFLGYIGSYFFQPGLVRQLIGIGEYVTNVHRSFGQLGTSHPDGSIALTVLISVVVGSFLGGLAGAALERQLKQD